MERIRISTLQPGQVFDQPLFSSSGQKLLNGGIMLTERHIAAIQRCGYGLVFTAQSLEELVETGVIDRFDSSGLRIGQTARGNLITDHGQVVVEAGDQIEAHHLDALAAGGHAAFVSKSKDSAQRRERVLLADTLVEELEQRIAQLPLRVVPEKTTTWIRAQDPNLWPALPELSRFRDEAVETLRQYYARIEAGVNMELSLFQSLADDLLENLAQHPTRFTQLALLCPRREDYLPDHAYTVTVLAMAVAMRLHWPLEAVREIGLAGLLYDLGMLLVPERIRTGACELTDIDRNRVQRHPAFSLALLQQVKGVNPLIQLAALQHHERENGTGYPRGVRASKTCDLARLLAIADTYAAITEPRHYRQPRLPYIAMEETLRAASVQLFWRPAVRALVQAAGLFPVGSFIKLSDGQNALVFAANPQQLDRPLVQPLNGDGKPKGPVIDLSTVPAASLTVVRPIPGAQG